MAGPCTEMMTAGPLSRPTKMLQDARSAKAEMLKLCIFVISLVEMLVGHNNGKASFAAWHRPNCSNFFISKFKRCSNKTSSVCIRFRPRRSKQEEVSESLLICVECPNPALHSWIVLCWRLFRENGNLSFVKILNVTLLSVEGLF